MTLLNWNQRQARTLARLARLRGIVLTPEIVHQLATRYAEKHDGQRATLTEGAKR